MTNNPMLSRLNRAALWRGLYWTFAGFILALPAVAMQFTGEVRWGPEDFAFAAIMLAATGGLLELVLRSNDRLAYRIGAAIAIAACFLVIWVNMAVGIIGSEDDPANLLFGVVIAIAMGGSLVARLEPRGMARTMVVTAGSQMLLFVVAWAYGLGFIPVITLFLAAMWLTAAWLFSLSARSRPVSA